MVQNNKISTKLSKQKLINHMEKLMLSNIDKTCAYAKIQVKDICKAMKSSRNIKYQDDRLVVTPYDSLILMLDEVIVALMELGCNSEIYTILDVVKYVNKE